MNSALTVSNRIKDTKKSMIINDKNPIMGVPR